MRIKPFYRWYDLWIGAFYDTKKRRLYLCFLGFGVWLETNPHCEVCGSFIDENDGRCLNSKCFNWW